MKRGLPRAQYLVSHPQTELKQFELHVFPSRSLIPLTVPLTLVTTSLFLIHVHPETVDDCPCFEDSIAIISAILGISLGTWQAPQIPTRLLGTYSVVEQIIVVALRITTGELNLAKQSNPAPRHRHHARLEIGRQVGPAQAIAPYIPIHLQRSRLYSTYTPILHRSNVSPGLGV